MPDAVAYKVLGADELEILRAGSWHGSGIDLQDGFVHLSTAAQLTETVAKHFAGQVGLVVAAIDLARLRDTVRWEPSRGGALFPHVYGPLTAESVIASASLAWDAEGVVRPS